MNESWRTHWWVMGHKWRNHGTHFYTYTGLIPHGCRSLFGSFIIGSIKLQVSFAEYRLFYRALLQKRPIIQEKDRAVAREWSCGASGTCVPWLIHMCTMTHSHVWHDSLPYKTWLIHICAMTHSHMCHDSFAYVPWHIQTSDVPHLSRDSSKSCQRID